VVGAQSDQLLDAPQYRSEIQPRQAEDEVGRDVEAGIQGRPARHPGLFRRMSPANGSEDAVIESLDSQ
jgi:hypothetical protein